MTDTTAPATETWTHQGRRVLATTRLGHLFDDGSARGCLFAKSLTGSLVGGRYQVQVQRDGERGRVVGTAVWTKETVTDTDRVDAWRAEDRAAQLIVERARLERHLAGADSSLDASFAPLERLARQCRTFAARDALTAEVIRRLHGCWRR